ncbi:MAG: Bile acid:sodium symporter, partial [uncultured Solirubrobacteraceae bacterium]
GRLHLHVGAPAAGPRGDHDLAGARADAGRLPPRRRLPEGRDDRDRQPAADLPAAGLRGGRGLRARARPRGGARAAGRLARRHHREHAHPSRPRGHRPVGDDDGGVERRRGRHRAAVPRALHVALRRDRLRRGRRHGRGGRPRLPDHGGAALDRHVPAQPPPRVGDQGRAAREADRVRHVPARRDRRGALGVRARDGELRRRGGRGAHPQPAGDVDLVHDRQARAPRRPPVHRDRHGARGPQLHPRDRRRGDHLDRPDDPRRGLLRLHVRHRRAVRAGDVPPQRRGRGRAAARRRRRTGL